MREDLIARLRERARIRRQIPTRKSVQNGEPDRIAALMDEAADAMKNETKFTQDLLAALEASIATLRGVKLMAETESRNGSNAWGRAAGLVGEQIAENRAAIAKAKGE